MACPAVMWGRSTVPKADRVSQMAIFTSVFVNTSLVTRAKINMGRADLRLKDDFVIETDHFYPFLGSDFGFRMLIEASGGEKQL